MKTRSYIPIGPVFGISLAALSFGQQMDPPARVGRLGYLVGDVAIERAETEGEWVHATLNWPVTMGDHLWTGQNGRAEVEIGAIVARLDAATDATFSAIDDQRVLIDLRAGNLYIRVRNVNAEDILEIHSPQISTRLLRSGSYRLQVFKTSTSAAVIEGAAKLSANGLLQDLAAQQRIELTGTETLQFTLSGLADPDEFDRFCQDRDKREEESVSAAYVSPQVPGRSDLDGRGVWHDDPQYGRVWAPSVAENWAPYRDGQWSWVEPWGWNWVGQEPWGFAPYHYGRWAYAGGTWVWVPGPIIPSPVYTPALVGFVGGPDSFVRVGGGTLAVSWFPLAPGDIYVPNYDASSRYWANININNTLVRALDVQRVYENSLRGSQAKIPHQKYLNQNIPGAVTAVSPSTFLSGQPILQRRIAVSPRDLRSCGVVGTAPRLAPKLESTLPTVIRTMSRPPIWMRSRQLVAGTIPPPTPSSFLKRQPWLAGNPGRPPSRAVLQMLQNQSRTISDRAQYRSPLPPGAAGAHANSIGAGITRRPGSPPTVTTRIPQPNSSSRPPIHVSQPRAAAPPKPPPAPGRPPARPASPPNPGPARQPKAGNNPRAPSTRAPANGPRQGSATRPAHASAPPSAARSKSKALTDRGI